jgi:O-antigen/teichoic acid export membrane protein
MKIIGKNSFISRRVESGLITSSAISQIIAFLFQLCSARLYSPDVFGEYVIYLSIIGVASVVATGKYDTAILTTNTDADSRLLLLLSFFISTLYCSVLLAISIIALRIFFIISDLPFLELLPLSIVGLYFVILTQILTAYLSRHEEYRVISYNQLLQSIFVGVSAIALGYFNFHDGLIYSHIISVIFASGFLILKTYPVLISFGESNKNLNGYLLFDVAKRYQKFPKYTMAQALVGQISTQMIPILIQSIYSTYVIGQYYLAYKLFAAPITMVSSSLSRVYTSEAANYYYNNRLYIYMLTKRRFLNLLIWSMSAGLIIYFISSYIVEFVYGDKWSYAGVLAKIIIPYLAVDFVVTPFMNLFLVAKLNKFYLIWDLLRGGSVLLLTFIAFKLDISATNFYSIQSTIFIIFLSAMGFLIYSKKSLLWNEVRY